MSRPVELFLVAVGQVGRFLYEWADRKLENGAVDVIDHARVRLGPVSYETLYGLTDKERER